ncbi:patatin-like phospholipase family protein [Nonomuraea angiospora]|uniref:patatin-like phospholipase family protein n=1 Tax=Nonomuraea angiospora TaxID=46172 RepID=UPI0033FA6EE2
MTTHNGKPTRALVLGGGGLVGIAWQSGLLTGLREAGLDLADADVILGTSAGSMVGALAASRTDFAAGQARMAAVAELVGPERLAAGFTNFMTAVWQVDLENDPEKGLREVAKAAEGADTIDEQAYLSVYEAFAGLSWPKAYHCTAVDAETGELVVWGPESGVPLQNAVASSCAVPMIYPTVTLKGRRYIDGGLANHLNAAAGPRTDRMIAISSVPLGVEVPGMPAAMGKNADRELAAVGADRWLATVEPMGRKEEGRMVNAMDPQAAPEAYELGLRQAEIERARLSAVWSSERPDA